MGYVVSHPSEVFGVEVRRESIILSEHYEVWPHTPTRLFGDGVPVHAVEVERAFLEQILAFFDNPENRALCHLAVPPPLVSGI